MSVFGVLPVVTDFLWLLAPVLSTPQFAWLARLVEALIVFEGRKTLARLLRLFPGPTSRSSVANFLTQSPWDEQMLVLAVQQFFFAQVLRFVDNCGPLAKKALWVTVRLDDVIVEKSDQAEHFQGADWHYDHNKNRHVYGHVFVMMHVSIGPLSCPMGFRLYMRAKTLRRLRRKKPNLPAIYGVHDDLRFRSKLKLARELLGEIEEQLKGLGLPVYVVFDSWYASGALMRFCRSKNWHVVCALRSNRKFQDKPLREHARTLGKKELSKVEIESSHGELAAYWVASFEGRLKDLSSRWRVVISFRKKREKSPFYLASSDLTLSLKQILKIYQGRWSIEVLHWSLKVKLGLGDFRVRSLRGVCRWMVVCLVAQSFLEWRTWQTKTDSPCEVITQIRQQRTTQLFRAALRRAKRGVRTKTILEDMVPLMT